MAAPRVQLASSMSFSGHDTSSWQHIPISQVLLVFLEDLKINVFHWPWYAMPPSG